MSAQHGHGRSDTPPRTGSAPIRLLRICLDERVLGGVEVNETATLADVRITITEDEIPGVPESYLFLFGGAPVSRRQESRRRAIDCFPFLTIIAEGAHVAATAAEGGATPLPTEASVPAPSFEVDLAHVEEAEVPVSAHHLHHPADAPEEEPPHESMGAAGRGATLELQITDGPLEGTTVTIGEEGASIGRHTSNTLVIPEAGISRYHCEICYSNGEFCVRDLGSTTGTYFYLRPQAQFQMFSGLMVKLGETEFQVLSQTPPDSEDPQQLVWFYEGPLAGHKAHVPAGGITIGRRQNNSLALPQDGTVSAHHASIFHEAGDFYISDLGSCNGTCVRLSAERADSDWHPIMDGDVLGAGCTKVRCRVYGGG